MRTASIAGIAIVLFAGSFLHRPVASDSMSKFTQEQEKKADKNATKKKLAQTQEKLSKLKATQQQYSYFPYTTLIDFLASPYNQKRLDLSDAQKEKLKALRNKVGEGYRKIYAKYPEFTSKDLTQEKRRELSATIAREYNELKVQLSKELEKDLVPHQSSLIKNLQFNQLIQSYGLSWTLSNAPYAKILETEKSQHEELKKIKLETLAEIQRVTKELQKKGKEKMLKVLNSKQRKQIESFQKDNQLPVHIRL